MPLKSSEWIKSSCSLDDGPHHPVTQATWTTSLPEAPQ